MARFDVYANPVAAERRHTPYLLDVQNDYIDSLPTRIVVPLRREAAFGPRARNLNPAFTIGADKVVLDTAAMGAVPLAELRKTASNLREERAAVQEALDTLFGAY
jgi:toxin CcdB